MKRELRELVTRSMDGRTTEARDVAEWTAAVASDLGGPDNLSTQERTLLDLAARSKLQLDRIDAWLFRQPQLVNRRTRALHPVVVQRQTLVTTLRGLLSDLGLKRRARDVGTLSEYLAERSASNGNGTSNDHGSTSPRSVLSAERSPGAPVTPAGAPPPQQEPEP